MIPLKVAADPVKLIVWASVAPSPTVPLSGENDPITVQADIRRAFTCHHKAILLSKKKVGFTAHILAGRSPGTPSFASKQLALYPAPTP